MIAIQLLLSVLACGDSADPAADEATQEATDADAMAEEAPAGADAATAEKAATIANQLAAGTNPDEVFATHELSSEDYRELLFEVAANPEMTKIYLEKRE